MLVPAAPSVIADSSQDLSLAAHEIGFLLTSITVSPSPVTVPISPAPQSAAAMFVPTEPTVIADSSQNLPLAAQEFGLLPTSIVVSPHPVTIPISLAPAVDTTVVVSSPVLPPIVIVEGSSVVDVVTSFVAVTTVGPSHSDSDVDEVFDIVEPPLSANIHGDMHPPLISDVASHKFASLA